jgi:hypothetical protein
LAIQSGAAQQAPVTALQLQLRGSNPYRLDDFFAAKPYPGDLSCLPLSVRLSAISETVYG